MTAELKTTTRLTGDKAAFAARLQDPESLEAAAVRDLTGRTGLDSAKLATIVSVLIEAGIEAVRQHAEEIGYARLGRFLAADPEHQAWRASRRARTARRLGEGEAV